MADGTVAVTLAGVVTSAFILDEAGQPILDESGLPVLADATFGSVTATGGSVSETLDNATSAAAGSSVGGSLAETLADVASAASAASGAAGTVTETLDNLTSAATGVHSVTGTLARTLANVTGAAGGTSLGSDYTYTWTGSNGSAWAGWTTVVGTVDVQSNKGRTRTAATAYAVAAARYNTPLAQDYGLRVDTTITTVTAAEFFGAINVRAGSTLFTDMMQRSSWHLRFVGTATIGRAELYRVSSTGVQTILGPAGADIDFVQGSVLHVRLLLSGSVFKARYWKNAETEPSTWQIDFDDGVNAPTGTGMSLAVRAGNHASFDDWRWDDLTVSVSSTGSVARTLANVTSAASGTHITGTVARTLANTMSSASGVYGTVSVTGTLAETLDAVTTLGAPLLDESGNPILEESGAPILEESGDGALGAVGAAGTVAQTLTNVTAAASGTAVSVVGTVAQTLANVTATTSAYSTVTATLARTLANAIVAAVGGSSNGGAVAQTLAPVVSQAAGVSGVSGTVAVTLANVTSVATGAAETVTGALAVTLDSVETGAPLTDDLGAVITDGAGDIVYVRGAEGLHGIGGTVAVTLADVTSTSAGSATTVVGTVAVTLEDTAAEASGSPGNAGTSAVTLENVTSTTAGTVGTTGSLAETLADTTSAADGTHDPIIIAGNVAVTLAAVTSAAAGVSVSGTVDEVLGDATSAADGTHGAVPVTGTLAVTLGNVTSTTAGDSTVIGALARTLADVVGDGVGSSVAGTVAVTLEDVTATTVGNVTITVYAVGRIESVYQMGPIEAVFETGRVVAVAGSRV